MEVGLTEEKYWFKKEGDYNVLYVGFVTTEDGHRACSGQETGLQIKALKGFEISIPDLSWKDIYNPEEERTILRFIEEDRTVRYKHLMADRPPTAVVWIKGTQIHRIEFYQGHDVLKKAHDVRSPLYTGPNEDSVHG